MIAAVSVGNFAIGYKGNLCYKIREDLIRFKSITMGHSIIMGRKTWESLPKLLEGRKNIVITSTPDKQQYPIKTEEEGPYFVRSLEEALNLCEGEDIVFIIGGESIYKQAFSIANTLYLTEVFDTPTRSDAFFPPYHGEFECVCREYRIDNFLRYEFTKYIRK